MGATGHLEVELRGPGSDACPTQPASLGRASRPPADAPRLASLSIVLPCWNEAENVESVVRQAAEVGRRVALAVEIVAVDDGSADGTARVLRRLGQEIGELRIVRHARNRGYGAALRSGFGRARGEYVFYTDADGQFDLGDLPALVEALESAELVTGYRRVRRDDFVRRANGAGWTWLTDALLGTGVRDVNCAFKLFPRRLVAPDPLTSTGALVGAELLSEARRRGMRVREVGVHHRPRVRGWSSGARPVVVARAFVELLFLVARRGAAPRNR